MGGCQVQKGYVIKRRLLTDPTLAATVWCCTSCQQILYDLYTSGRWSRITTQRTSSKLMVVNIAIGKG
jgi:hypothetical protein